MNAGAFGDRQPEVVTPETLLLDTAERIGRVREGRLALHLHLSRLLPGNRDEARIRIAFRMFESMVSIYRGQIFLLSNSDILMICKDAPLSELDAIVFKLRALFASDPLTYAESPDGSDRFVSFYDIEADYNGFYALCEQMAGEVRKFKADRFAAPPPRPLDPATLPDVLDALASADITAAVRRQACVRIDDSAAEVEFQEFYISIADLQQAVSPGVGILANRWLFQHLSSELDKRVLSVLRDPNLCAPPRAYSLNLTIATIDSPAFRDFEQEVRGRAGLLVEFQLIDVFADLAGFFRVRDQLRAQGHRTVLDGLSPITVQYLDGELFDTDFVKLTWGLDLLDDVRTAEIRAALAPVGFDRVILSRCDSESAIAWGLSLGIRRFQGRFLDSMIAAVTMGRCTQVSNCTLGQCTVRHGVVSGPPRAECRDNAMLDQFPPLRFSR